TNGLHLFACGRGIEPLQTAVAIAYAEVVCGQDVGALHRVDQQHFDRPPADPAQCHQPLDERFVGHGQRLRARGHDAVQRGLGDAANGRQFGRREAARAQRCLVRVEHLLRRGKRSSRIEREETAEDGVAGLRVQLLIGDGADQRFIRLARRLGGVAAGPDGGDMARPVFVQRRQKNFGLPVGALGQVCGDGHARDCRSAGLAEREVDALAAQRCVRMVFERCDAVITQAIRPAPDDNITVKQGNALRLVGTAMAAKQEDGRHAERHGDDRRAVILLVFVLMQRHARARHIAVDEARVRRKAGKACFCGGVARQPHECVGQRRPRVSRERVERGIAVAAAVRGPAQRAAVGQRD
ncbi:hypothetical protein COLO4_01197, partial [Corchorus olitorius]